MGILTLLQSKKLCPDYLQVAIAAGKKLASCDFGAIVPVVCRQD